jgi:hypothetical protein
VPWPLDTKSGIKEEESFCLKQKMPPLIPLFVLTIPAVERKILWWVVTVKGDGTSVAVLHLYDTFHQTWHIYYPRPQEQLLLQRFFYKFRP